MADTEQDPSSGAFSRAQRADVLLRAQKARARRVELAEQTRAVAAQHRLVIKVAASRASRAAEIAARIAVIRRAGQHLRQSPDVDGTCSSGSGWRRLIARGHDLDGDSGSWFLLSTDMLFVATLEGRFVRLNKRWREQLGHCADDLLALSLPELVHPDDRFAAGEALRHLASAPGEVQGVESRIPVKQGGWRWLLWSARSDGERIYGAGKDITVRKQLELEREGLISQLEALARTDELTGLPNRRAWHEELCRDIARSEREGGTFSVALFDLDGFKDVNDRLGHQAGDRLLEQAAAAWRAATRISDFIARFGGDEFAILLAHCPPEDGPAAIERIRSATPAPLTASAGIAVWEPGERPEALLARADAALYAAKTAGRDRLNAAAPRLASQ